MIRVHHLDDSRSFRILWLLEELGMDYDIVEHRRNRRTMLAPEALRRVHPLGKAPVVELEDDVVAETGAIVETLLDRAAAGASDGAVPGLRPARGTPEHARYRYWLHYGEGSVMPILLLKLVMDRIKRDAPIVVRPVGWLIATSVDQAYLGAQMRLHADYMEAQLSPWFGGAEFSAADVVMSFPVQGMLARGPVDARSHPRLYAYQAACEARPAFQRAVEKGGRPKLG
jgi:glutathione S-transferase